MNLDRGKFVTTGLDPKSLGSNEYEVSGGANALMLRGFSVPRPS